MRDKLDGLSFLDHRVAPVVSTIDALLNRIPTKGAIEGAILQEILATAMLLADPDKTRRHGEGLLSGQGRVIGEDENPNSDAGVKSIDSDNELKLNPVNDKFTGLFDGIFEDDEDIQPASINVTIPESNIQSQSDFKPELVTTEDDEEGSEHDSWF